MRNKKTTENKYVITPPPAALIPHDVMDHLFHTVLKQMKEKRKVIK